MTRTDGCEFFAGSGLYKIASPPSHGITVKDEIRTDFLVLHKIAYGETSLIVKGLTCDRGLASFMVRGARRVGRSQTPVVDLFRVLRIVYAEGRSDLHTWRQADLVEDFGALAGHLPYFEAASRLARFVLSHTGPGVDSAGLFQAMRVALKSLADGVGHGKPSCLAESATCGVLLGYLAESGLLPHYEPGTADAGRMQLLLRAAAGAVPQPSLPQETWNKLQEWCQALLANADIA